MRGTPAAFEMLLAGPDKPNMDTLYFISDKDASSARLYLGSKLIAGEGASVDLSLDNLSNVLLSDDLKDKSILMYNKNSGLWTGSTLEDIVSVFIGASGSSAGIGGLVPAPELGQTNLFLRSDGTWASIGEVSSSNDQLILTVENETSTTMHQDIINNATEDILLTKGDIIIIKDLICEDKWQYTSYVYNGSTWAAMDGNYNAENIYFDEDFTFTKDIGTVEVPSSGSITLDTSGKNLKDFLAELFAKEEKPAVTLPSISFNSPQSSSVEVGTKLSVAYSLSFNKGTYQYNSDTGVKVLGWTVSDGINTETKQNATMPEVQIEDNMTYSLSATVRYSDGIVPNNNLGKPCKEKQILADTTKSITSSSITGYRNVFGGLDMTGEVIDSNFIRTNLKFLGNASTNKDIVWEATEMNGAKRYILAIPQGGNKTFISAIITSSMNADATADYIKQPLSVSVEGANGYESIPYDIWIYEPASIASTEKHKITIK